MAKPGGSSRMNGSVAAVVLAAGAGRRFGGGKLLAALDGRPILQHVLDALAVAGIEDPVVVLGEDAEALEAAIAWRAARRVRNEDPGRGLSSSLRVGWQALHGGLEAPPEAPPVVVVLGDQPRLDPAVVRALAAAPEDADRPVVVARHEDGSRNPVRLEPAAWVLVAETTGDRGLGPILDVRPDLVRTLEVQGTNPDIDTRSDLAALLAERWAELVRANAAQVERIREVEDGHDFYGPVTRTFVADPDRTDDPVLDVLAGLARPDETWLDIGSGAGRYALPLARLVHAVIAVDPSPSMLEALGAGMRRHGISNLRVAAGRWPPDAALRAVLGPDPVADVTLIAHVGYDVEEIGTFLDAMEAAARRGCAAVLMDQSPASVAAPFWPLVHGEARVPLPALPQFLELLAARGAVPEVIRVAGERRSWADRDELVGFLRRQLWLAPGSPADDRLVAAVGALTTTAADGSTTVVASRPLEIGVLHWSVDGSSSSPVLTSGSMA